LTHTERHGGRRRHEPRGIRPAVSAPFFRRATPTLAIFLALTCATFRRALANPLDQPIPVRLAYTVAPGSSGCPAEETFHALVAHHLEGTDPFTGKDDSSRVAVEVSRDGVRYKVVLTLYDAAGKRLDGIDTPIKGNTCVSAVEAAGGVVVDLLPMRTPAPTPAPVPAPAPKPPAPPSQAELPPEDPAPAPKPVKPALVWRAGVLARVDVLPVANPAMGISADVGFRISSYSLAVQFHALPSATQGSGSTSSGNATLVAAGLVACWRIDAQIKAQMFVLAGCGLGEGGNIRRTPPAGHATPVAGGPFGSFGGQIEAEIPFGSVYVRVAGDVVGIGQSNLSSGIRPAPGAGAGIGYSF
jgi:hypothetical protein